MTMAMRFRRMFDRRGEMRQDAPVENLNLKTDEPMNVDRVAGFALLPAEGNGNLSRRGFLAAGAGTLALTILDNACDSAAPPPIKSGTHHIPSDKGLDPKWVEALFTKGAKKVYSGDELTCIGMPIGGICAGQLYLRGDGTLAEWGIFNVDRFTGFGDTSYRTYTPPSPVEQGFGIAVTPERRPDRLSHARSSHGFPQIEFSGEYPIGKVRYRRREETPSRSTSPSRRCSPFVPLDARHSATAGDDFAISREKHVAQPVDVAFGGWIQNPVGQRHVGRYRPTRQNRAVHEGLTSLMMSDRANRQRRPPATCGSLRCLPTSRGTRTANGKRREPRSANIRHTARCPISNR